VDEQSIWKKEISFGRKRKEERAEGGDAPAAEATSIWKKELSLGRKKKDDAPAAPEPVVEAEPEPAPAEERAEAEQVWTRAVSFGRKAADEVRPEESTVELPTAEAPVVEDVVPEEPIAEAPAVEEQTWTKAVSFSRKTDPAPQPEPERVSAAPEPEPEPAAAEAETLVVEARPEPASVAEHKVPFWKKEISLGGGKNREQKPKQPKAAKEPKRAKAAKEPKPPKQPKERKAKEPKVKAARGARGAKRIVGLKVGASQIAAARVANNGVAELLQVARQPLEPGIVVGGELRDPDALAQALKEFFAKHKLPKKGVRLGIANNRIGVRTFDIAGINDQKQLTNAIRFRAQEALPIPIDEAVLDYQVLGESVDEQGQPAKRILLVVAYRELIDRYMGACKKAGITLSGIDLEAFALLRALQAPQEGVDGDAGAALVAVAIGHERSTFAVSDGHICEFTRVLEWGGGALNVAIARAVDAAPSEVDGVKRALSLTDEMVPDGLTSEQAKKARDSMRRAIQTFARELVSSLQYYQNQPGSLGIGEIVLTGGTAHLPGLAGELERLIGVRVRVGDPLARMKVSKKLGEAEQVGSLAIAIGLGIED
jgi:type IV pilus assembly protein PilM